MIYDNDLNFLADGFCEYCGMPYLVTGNEFDNDSQIEEFGQCPDCHIADLKYGGPWNERYDQIN